MQVIEQQAEGYSQQQLATFSRLGLDKLIKDGKRGKAQCPKQHDCVKALILLNETRLYSMIQQGAGGGS